MNIDEDIMGLAGKVQITYESKSYYIPLPGKYYDIYSSIGDSEDGKGILANFKRLLKKASTRSAGVRAKKIATKIASNAAGLIGKNKK